MEGLLRSFFKKKTLLFLNQNSHLEITGITNSQNVNLQLDVLLMVNVRFFISSVTANLSCKTDQIIWTSQSGSGLLEKPMASWTSLDVHVKMNSHIWSIWNDSTLRSKNEQPRNLFLPNNSSYGLGNFTSMNVAKICYRNHLVFLFDFLILAGT